MTRTLRNQINCYAENAICYIDDVTVKGFQGGSRSIANIIKAVLSAQVCARGRDWLDSVALLLSVSERDRVDIMALGGAKYMYYVSKLECERDFEKTGEPSR